MPSSIGLGYVSLVLSRGVGAISRFQAESTGEQAQQVTSAQRITASAAKAERSEVFVCCKPELASGRVRSS
jgi:hypothetical protein